MYLGAHVLLPLGFDEHPDARYPFVIFHGHFPETFEGFREEPPDPDLKPKYSERFHLAGYNRIEQEQAYQLYKDWTSPGFPRAIVVEIQHANPYYDDSYAVNSENLGPYGDAIEYELIPYLEKKYRGDRRGLGALRVRRLDRRLGSDGGPGLLSRRLQRHLRRLSRSDRLPRLHGRRHLQGPERLLDRTRRGRRRPAPAMRDSLGHVSATRGGHEPLELVLGTNGRSGEQWDIWQAVYSPVGADGYPKPIWDQKTGVIDKDVAAYWRDHFDLTAILKRDWEKGLGKKLEGKLHIFVGEADSYYLNDAVYLAEDFLKTTKNPPSGGEVDYEPRAEHCWNGDHTRPNAISRLQVPPDVPAEDRRADPEDGAARGGPQELGLLGFRRARRRQQRAQPRVDPVVVERAMAARRAAAAAVAQEIRRREDLVPGLRVDVRVLPLGEGLRVQPVDLVHAQILHAE